MAHYAKIENGVVQQVIVAEQDYVDTLDGLWVQTSYNTRGGIHLNGGVPLRKNYAGVGFIYDQQRDAFIPPKTYDDWVLDEESCLWVPPVPYPTDGKTYKWDEPTKNWVEVYGGNS